MRSSSSWWKRRWIRWEVVGYHVKPDSSRGRSRRVNVRAIGDNRGYMKQFGTAGRTWLLGMAIVALLGAPGRLTSQITAATRQELSLEEALRMALTGNRELETARLQLAEAEGRAREAWSAVYPTVNATANYSRNLQVPGTFLP